MNKPEILKAKVNYHRNYSNQFITAGISFLIASYMLRNQDSILALFSIITGISFLFSGIYYAGKYNRRYKELIDSLNK